MTRLDPEIKNLLFDPDPRPKRRAARTGIIKHGALTLVGKNLLHWAQEQPQETRVKVAQLLLSGNQPLLLTAARQNAPLSKSEFYNQNYWQDPKMAKHMGISGSGRLPINQVPFIEVRGEGKNIYWYVYNPYTKQEYIYPYEKVDEAIARYNNFYPEYLNKQPKLLNPTREEPVSVPEFKASSAGINKSIAARSHAFSSFNPELRARQEVEGFKDDIQQTYESLKKFAVSPAQKELLNEEMARFQAGMARRENDILSTKGRTASTMITGGSNFNTRRNQKALDSEHNKYLEQKDFEERAIAAIKRKLKELYIEEHGGELEVMKAQIVKAKEKQERNKHINQIIRKKLPADETVKMLVDKIGISKTLAQQLITGKTKWDIGIPAWELQNNLANIKRMEQRVKEMEKKEATPTSEKEFTMGRIVDNADEDRIQIFFNEKLEELIRTKLKASGWRWSPNAGAWQRKRTDAAKYSAEQILR